ncbi:hypothetical protein RHGRI_031795 [Rhododendron griersonianum]|uniref:Uncharacterized protein n=1 Tax=Rhododendron griersonianum TaxID=479676 RepID=A0AAV6IDX9_9ERIC|nr:hypothetical protein RHGRI_031795 [Rhododendron griersonianum]
MAEGKIVKPTEKQIASPKDIAKTNIKKIGNTNVFKQPTPTDARIQRGVNGKSTTKRGEPKLTSELSKQSYVLLSSGGEEEEEEKCSSKVVVLCASEAAAVGACICKLVGEEEETSTYKEVVKGTVVCDGKLTDTIATRRMIKVILVISAPPIPSIQQAPHTNLTNSTKPTPPETSDSLLPDGHGPSKSAGVVFGFSSEQDLVGQRPTPICEEASGYHSSVLKSRHNPSLDQCFTLLSHTTTSPQPPDGSNNLCPITVHSCSGLSSTSTSVEPITNPLHHSPSESPNVLPNPHRGNVDHTTDGPVLPVPNLGSGTLTVCLPSGVQPSGCRDHSSEPPNSARLLSLRKTARRGGVSAPSEPKCGTKNNGKNNGTPGTRGGMDILGGGGTINP